MSASTISAIQGAIERGMDDTEPVGIPAIDAALPHIRGDKTDFLRALAYLMQEGPNSLDRYERRKDSTDKAARLIREAAALLDGADNPALATLLLSIAEHAEGAACARITPESITPDGALPPPAWVEAWERAQFTPGVMPHAPTDWGSPDGGRRGPVLQAHVELDALSGMLSGRRGGKSDDANIVKWLARFFPDSSAYAVIAALAVLCGVQKPSPAAYVRSVLKSSKSAAKNETPQPRHDNSIVGLLTGNKPA